MKVKVSLKNNFVCLVVVVVVFTTLNGQLLIRRKDEHYQIYGNCWLYCRLQINVIRIILKYIYFVLKVKVSLKNNLYISKAGMTYMYLILFIFFVIGCFLFRFCSVFLKTFSSFF